MNSFTEIIVAKNDFLAKQKETQRTANWQSSINNKIIHEQEIEKLKNEFIEMGVIDAFTQIIDNRILSSLWDKPEEATYNFLGMKKIIKPAYFGEKEAIVFDKDRVSLDLHGKVHGEVMSYNWDDGPNQDPISIISIIKQKSGTYEIGFNEHGHIRDRYICDFLEKKIVSKDEVVNSIAELVATYRELHKIKRAYQR